MPLRVDHVDVALTLVGAQLVDLLLEVGVVDREQVDRQVEALPARIVAVEAALEVAGDRRQPPRLVLAHADRVELERAHAEVVVQLPELGQVLHQRRDDLLGRAEARQRVGDDEGLQSGERIERNLRDLALVELLDVHAAVMRERHRRRAEMRVESVIEK